MTFWIKIETDGKDVFKTLKVDAEDFSIAIERHTIYESEVGSLAALGGGAISVSPHQLYNRRSKQGSEDAVEGQAKAGVCPDKLVALHGRRCSQGM